MKHINKTKAIVLGLLCFISTLAVYGQGRRISGQVLDAENSSELPGVNVRVKDTSTGTITDLNGNFSLELPADNTVLVFSFVGYTTQEVEVGNRSTVDVKLAPDAKTLQEIVVTGYSSEDRRTVTGAVATVSAEKMKAVPSGNVEQALQGRAAGVTVITNGQPGTQSVVRVRGFGGFGGNEPLYVVDGVPVESTNFLQPDDIETTTVLKDAASASIYGARAANGVIVYTTKKGKKGDGKVRINYDGLFGVTVPGKVDHLLNPQEQADWTWAAIRNTSIQNGTELKFDHPQYGTGTTPVIPDYLLVGDQQGVVGSVNLADHAEKYNIDPRNGEIYQVVKANKAGTNWYDEITRTAPIHRHTLSFAGGGENNVFYISLGVQDQQGILINNDLKRYSLRVNSAFDILPNFRIGENFQTTYYSAKGIIGAEGGRGAAGGESAFTETFRNPSIIPVYDEFGGYAGTAVGGFNNGHNPVANRERLGDNTANAFQGFGNLYAEVDVIEGLTLRSSIGGGYNNGYLTSYSPPTYENAENTPSYGYSEQSFTGYNWTFTNTAKYDKAFGDHELSLLAGTEALNTGVSRSIVGTGQNPFSYDPNYITLSNTQSTGRNVTSGYGRGVNFYSVFGQAKYTFADKYIINGVVRRDGSSRFGANNRYGIFPAASVAWRLSEENFMAGVPFISDLKIRAGYGEMGNSNNVDPYNQFSLFQANLGLAGYDVSGSNNSVAEGFFRGRLGNPNAQWETAVTSNIGLDATLFDGAFDVIVDFWRKDTEDLLYQLPVAAVLGNRTASPSINVAEMRNQGIDLELVARGKASSLGYEVSATGTFLKNEIVSLAPGITNFPAATGSRIGALILNQVGRPMSSFYGYQVEGLFQDQAEVSAAPAQDGAAPGRFRYADINGDGKITPDDRTYLGDPIPAFSGGINVKLNYGNFDFETFFAAFLGFENYNFGKWYTDFYSSFPGAAKGVNVRESFTFERGGNTVPIFEDVSNFSTNTQSSSYYVEKGNYGRLMNLQIGYSLPETALSRAGFEKVRFFVQGINLFTISNYSGLDPGVGGAADTSLGIDVGNPPVTRGFNVGVNLGF